MASESDRVVPLRRLDDFRVAEGDPDVRGWEVQSADGSRLGRVDELLVDTGAMKVRYLDVDVDRELVSADRHVLVPIGYARLERDRDCVIVDNLDAEQLRGMPAYDTASLENPDYERSVRESFSADRAGSGGSTVGAGASTTGGIPADVQVRDAYDDEQFYASRRGSERSSGAGRSEVRDPLGVARGAKPEGSDLERPAGGMSASGGRSASPPGVSTGDSAASRSAGTGVGEDSMGLGGGQGARDGLSGRNRDTGRDL